MEQIINNENLTILTTGTVGYVHIDKAYDNSELNPRFFEVDLRSFETVG